MKLLNQIVLLIALFSVVTSAAQRIVVDSNGVMRRADNGDEVSFYGVNYTVPFAYSYRELARKGVDRKEAIDHDVYHFARLGFNAFRLHLWDVELTDSVGTLQENEHLDLLDYLIYRLKQRGISIVITAQTNFGNGYPELNQPTGGYSYLYEKCHVHDTPSAVSAQERYIKALIKHQNPYTGLSLADDDSVIAIEVNNEPCHSGNEKDVCRYVNRMVKAIKTAGFKKPIFYNVSHNLQVTQGFYDANIDGTTYQWYPIGLATGISITSFSFVCICLTADSIRISICLSVRTRPFDASKSFRKLSTMIFLSVPAPVLSTICSAQDTANADHCDICSSRSFPILAFTHGMT